MLSLTVILAAVAISSALPVKRDTEYPSLSSFIEHFGNIQVDSHLSEALTNELGDLQQGTVFGGSFDQKFSNWNNINTDEVTLPKFSASDFDWQKYLEDVEESDNGKDFNNGMVYNTDSFDADLQKYIDNLPKFSAPDFDWDKYLETVDEGIGGQDTGVMSHDISSIGSQFDLEKYMDKVNEELADLGLNN